MSATNHISVAMAVYNGERFIREQLDSFARQERCPDELIVSDNCSSDCTREIVRGFASTAPFPVTLRVNDRNLGVTTNFERAIEACSGDLIFLSDSDDVWYPGKILLMEQSLANNPSAGIAYCDADLVDEQLRPLGKRLWQECQFRVPRRRVRQRMIEGRSLRRLYPFGNCMVFRAALRTLFLPFPNSDFCQITGHDVFIMRVVRYSGAAGVVVLPIPLIAYRQHANQAFGGVRKSAMSRIGSLLDTWSNRILPRASLGELAAILERAIKAPAEVVINNDRMRKELIRHYRTRLGLPTLRVARFPLICRELSTLRYHKFSSGFRSAAKDLLFLE